MSALEDLQREVVVGRKPGDVEPQTLDDVLPGLVVLRLGEQVIDGFQVLVRSEQK